MMQCNNKSFQSDREKKASQYKSKEWRMEESEIAQKWLEIVCPTQPYWSLPALYGGKAQKLNLYS